MVEGMADFKVFIAESNGAEDLYCGRMDGFAAGEVLKVQQIETRYRAVMNRDFLVRAVKEAHHFGADIFHLSCHGDSTGPRLHDGTDLSWDELADIFQPFANRDRVLVNSICEGGHDGIAKAFKEKSNKFGFICGSISKNGIYFDDACLAWSVLYNVLGSAKSANKSAFQSAINKMNSVVDGDFVYRRWDEPTKLYKYYPKSKKLQK